jgi:phage tail protein X
MWRGDAPRSLSARQLAEFDRAMQEIRFHVMATGAASGSEAVEDATLLRVDRQTVRHVLQEGLGWELERAEAERSTLEAGMKTNAQMRTRPGDSASADYLTDLRVRQVARLKAATDEVNRAREGLAATGMAVPPAPSPAPSQ